MVDKQPKVDVRKKPDLWLQPPSYQPTKAEMEEDMSIDATPEEVAASLMRDVNVRLRGVDDAPEE
ncbi:MAG: hypothetical protein OXD46_14945 [Chloroflexi bacterium]|nr:hypothetical protein [Chloroflexota bacterium]